MRNDYVSNLLSALIFVNWSYRDFSGVIKNVSGLRCNCTLRRRKRIEINEARKTEVFIVKMIKQKIMISANELCKINAKWGTCWVEL